MSETISEQEHRTAVMRACIQKVATGPEYSKDLSDEEAYEAMQIILSGEANPVQAGIYLIALRMKRETDVENRASLRAIRDTMDPLTVDTRDLIEIADPYDGWLRGLPVSAFTGPVLAAEGISTVSTGLESVGPKHGMNHFRVLKAAGIKVTEDQHTVKNNLENPDIGWGYIDQRKFCPALHALLPLRQTIVKRPLITTLEVLTKPFVASGKTHLMTGYVHKAYPPVYTSLARSAEFDSALIVRGVEGGVTPSLQQSARCFSYHDSEPDSETVLNPTDLDIHQNHRCVPLPDDLPMVTKSELLEPVINVDVATQAAAAAGLSALNGERGPAYDSLVYAAALALHHIGRSPSLADAAKVARNVIDSGKAKAHFDALALT